MSRSLTLKLILAGLLLSIAAFTAGAPHPELPEDVDADVAPPGTAVAE